MIPPAMNQDEQGLVRVAPINIVQLEALRVEIVRGRPENVLAWHECPFLREDLKRLPSVEAVSSKSSAAMADSGLEVIAGPFTKVGQATFDCSQKVAHAFDRAKLYIRVKELLQRQAGDLGAFASHPYSSLIELFRKRSRQAKGQLMLHIEVLSRMTT